LDLVESIVLDLPFAKNSPTGIVANDDPNAFIINNAVPKTAARIIVCTEQGTINAWNENTDNSALVVAFTLFANYKGLTIAAERLYVANFGPIVGSGSVDVFDSSFQRILSFIGKFADPNGMPGYAPFNIAYINGHIYVLYALHNPLSPGDDLPGVGHGYINVFTLEGDFVKRFHTGVPLNSPWGIIETKERIIVGNFGDGHINTFDHHGKFTGELTDCHRNPLVIDGLWGLTVDHHHNTIYFASGPNDEENGLVGKLNLCC